jgi:hypothetical protein
LTWAFPVLKNEKSTKPVAGSLIRKIQALPMPTYGDGMLSPVHSAAWNNSDGAL